MTEHLSPFALPPTGVKRENPGPQLKNAWIRDYAVKPSVTVKRINSTVTRTPVSAVLGAFLLSHLRFSYR
jgi:hypothetical protein